VRTLETATHGRYLLRPALGSGAAQNEAAPLVVGFHGYAENATTSLEALETVPGIRGWHVLAVQALNRFYTRTGAIAAGWMTREDRELAIADNVAYAAGAVAAARREVQVAGPVVVGGFSQGTCMAWRAAALALDDCAGVIALGGDVPPELGRVEWRSHPRVLIGRGDADTWYTADKQQADLELLAGLGGGAGLEVELCEFTGGHEWTDPFRQAAGEFLARLGSSVLDSGDGHRLSIRRS
jgi:predicted esterase